MDYAQLLVAHAIPRGLLGPREAARIWERHLLNCAVVTDLCREQAVVYDVGSGAGLPGIVWAIRRPDLAVTLLEPLLRRVTFLMECGEARLAQCDRAAQPRGGRGSDNTSRHRHCACGRASRSIGTGELAPSATGRRVAGDQGQRRCAGGPPCPDDGERARRFEGRCRVLRDWTGGTPYCRSTSPKGTAGGHFRGGDEIGLASTAREEEPVTTSAAQGAPVRTRQRTGLGWPGSLPAGRHLGWPDITRVSIAVDGRHVSRETSSPMRTAAEIAAESNDRDPAMADTPIAAETAEALRAARASRRTLLPRPAHTRIITVANQRAAWARPPPPSISRLR